MPGLAVHSLLDAESGLALTAISGKAGLFRKIGGSRIQKQGLALTGYVQHVHPERMQVLGLTEISFFRSLDDEARKRGAQSLASVRPCCVIITRGLEAPVELLLVCEEQGVPLLTTPLMSSLFINRVTRLLENRLAPGTTIHGVLVDVLGVGVLLLGKSGVGKSEAALDLVMRGHRLVADDVIEIRKRMPDLVVGSCSEILKHHMEVRGLGILSIKDLFGIASVRDAKKVDLVIELSDWNADEEYDRLGIDDLRYAILDVALPLIKIPVRPGRNIAAIIEVAARNQLLKQQGIHSAREFQDKLSAAMQQSRPHTGLGTADDIE